jgi:Zn-dependent protease
MSGSLTFGYIFGIPLRLHISWFLIMGLIVWSLAIGVFPQEYPAWSATTYWVVGFITAILFFTSVLIHELGHSVVALREGVPVRSITLFIFGGVAQIGHDPETAGTEFRIAIAGPLTSLGLAALFFLGGFASRFSPEAGASALYLSRINLLLAVFNMIPGFPLDGGRVLRAILWQVGGNFRKATRWATTVGQAVAFLFIVFGVWMIFTGNFLNGIWIAFIGWFLNNAADHSYQQVVMRTMLEGVTARQLMVQNCPTIPGELILQDLVDEHVLGQGNRCFFVAQNGHLQGMLTIHNVKAVAHDRWNQIRSAEVMTPLDQILAISPDEDAWTLIRKMDESNVNQVPVMENGRLVGMITRERLLHYIRTRTELGI